MSSMSSGEVLSKLRAEGGTPSADLWFGGGIDAFFMSAKDDGLLEPVNFDAGCRVSADEYKDTEGYWYSKLASPLSASCSTIPLSWRSWV